MGNNSIRNEVILLLLSAIFAASICANIVHMVERGSGRKTATTKVITTMTCE